MIPVAEPGRSGRTWKNLCVTGFALQAEAQASQVYALTAQGTVHAIAPSAIRSQPKTAQAIVLPQDDKIVALFSLTS
jgi:hypothetical protein